MDSWAAFRRLAVVAGACALAACGGGGAEVASATEAKASAVSAGAESKAAVQLEAPSWSTWLLPPASEVRRLYLTSGLDADGRRMVDFVHSAEESVADASTAEMQARNLTWNWGVIWVCPEGASCPGFRLTYALQFASRLSVQLDGVHEQGSMICGGPSQGEILRLPRSAVQGVPFAVQEVPAATPNFSWAPEGRLVQTRYQSVIVGTEDVTVGDAGWGVVPRVVPQSLRLDSVVHCEFDTGLDITVLMREWYEYGQGLVRRDMARAPGEVNMSLPLNETFPAVYGASTMHRISEQP